jgi:ParB family transcriptional regulator, chromosome partitioning protein
MRTDAANAKLEMISVERIDRNDENPRLYFRPRELETLQHSIAQHGIQVPINVFRKANRFVLIDGERRWKCALKLNLKTIPALVQDEPTQLTNVLLMFNIHALREQWDLLTIAVKLPRVIALLEKANGRRPIEQEIIDKTGLTRSIIRRCKLLMDLPEMYREQLLEELHKPKPQQKLTEDFFIEMERALKTCERAMPGLIKGKNKARDIIIKKYRSGVIKDIVDLRLLPRMAKAEKVNADVELAAESLQRVFTLNDYSIETAYEDSVSWAYSGFDLLQRIRAIAERLDDIEPDEVDPHVVKALRELNKRIKRLLEIKG